MSTALEHPRVPGSPSSVGGPRGLWLLLPVTVLASLAGMGTVALLQSVRYERFPGHLQAAGMTLTAPRDARLATILVDAGRTVACGVPVFELVDEKLDAEIEQHQGLVAALDKEVSQVEAKLAVEIQERRRVLHQEVFETKLKSAAFLRQKFTSEVEQLAWKQVVEEMDDGATKSGSLVRATGFSVNDREADRIAALLKQEAANNAQEVSAAQAEICDQRLAELTAIERDLPEQLRKSMGLEVLAQRQTEAKTRLERLVARKAELSVPARRPVPWGCIRCGRGTTFRPTGRSCKSSTRTARMWWSTFRPTGSPSSNRGKRCDWCSRAIARLRAKSKRSPPRPAGSTPKVGPWSRCWSCRAARSGRAFRSDRASKRCMPAANTSDPSSGMIYPVPRPDARRNLDRSSPWHTSNLGAL